MAEHPLVAPIPLAHTASALSEGTLDLNRHVEAAIARIAQHDSAIRAMLPEPGRRERLAAEVRALHERFPEPSNRPPLFGILVAVKDIIAVEGVPMRAGSALPPEAFDQTEATAVARLRDAGALILGKAVTTEFAYFDPGATANPHDPSRTPGGSSSGSAAAVAAGYASLALGSQTVGSVIRPAAFCGVVGFKPTYGRVSSEGMLAYSPSVDTMGWFTPDVAGARLAASVLLDGWDDSPMIESLPVIGVPEGAYLAQASADGLAAFEAALDRLAAEGFQVRRVALLNDITTLTERHRWLTTAEFHETHTERFARYGSLYRGISAELFDAGGPITAEQRRAGFEGRGELRERLHHAMDEHGIDVWASPAALGAAPVGLRSTGDPVMNLPWTHAGVPALTLPAGFIDGMPAGLQLAARAGLDEALLAWAEGLEATLAS
jgi:Asp-tRNA(Asn)/Glu-tRNA(Gln) amidotransferase A subunit family amidase